ncbi:MAG: Hsp70 family protein, partial [Actinobacteria bacterium]|nr:Hsp70 family protein [Actinomycetota bacterium]
EDRRRREEAEVRNNADALVYQTEKLLADQGDKLGTGDRDQLEAALRELKEKLSGGDVEAIRSATERLTTANHSVAQSLYDQASNVSAAAGGSAASSSSDEDGVDAEILGGGDDS